MCMYMNALMCVNVYIYIYVVDVYNLFCNRL